MSEQTWKLDLEIFPQQIIDLNIETGNHPDLMAILRNQPNTDVYIRLLEIASYCDILVIGDFSRDQILDLCVQMTQKLYSMRTSIILPMH